MDALQQQFLQSARRLEEIEHHLQQQFQQHQQQQLKQQQLKQDSNIRSDTNNSSSSNNNKSNDTSVTFPLNTLRRLRRLQTEWIALQQRHDRVLREKLVFLVHIYH